MGTRITRKPVTLAVALAVVTGLAVVGMALAAATTPGAGDSAAAVAKDRLPAKYAPIDVASLVVFADKTSGDLWVTDAEGNGPVRIAETRKVIETNPAGWFPWVVYEGTRVRSGNSDIYMESLLGDLADWGKARIRVTDSPYADTDPSIIAMPSALGGRGQPAADVQADPRLSVFGDPLIMFSSDRFAGHGDCGVEAFFEYLNLTGPIQVSECNGVDKLSVQLDNPMSDGGFLGFAYTGARPNGANIWVDDIGDAPFGPGPMDPVRVTSSGEAAHPTWAPMSFVPSPTPTPTPDAADAPAAPRQPAGDYPITYQNNSGPKSSLWTVTETTNNETLSDGKNLINPEWYNFAEECLLFERTATYERSVVAYSCGETIMDLTSPTKFYVTGADWLGEPFIT